jgi:hypothetical protein
MSRVLACVPHFFRKTATDSGMAHGSNRDSLEIRVEQLSYCLRNLAAILAPVRFLMGSPGQVAHEKVEALPQLIEGDIVVVTAPENNLLDEVSFVGFSQARLWAGPPRQLGYQCRRVFARHVGQYDFYLFIEDDTAILDPAFFRKVAAFYRAHGDEYVLQPNRFEIYGSRAHGWRAYLDQPAFPQHRATEQAGPEELKLRNFDGDVVFRKTRDGMSGAYINCGVGLASQISTPRIRRRLRPGWMHLNLPRYPLVAACPSTVPRLKTLIFWKFIMCQIGFRPWKRQTRNCAI